MQKFIEREVFMSNRITTSDFQTFEVITKNGDVLTFKVKIKDKSLLHNKEHLQTIISEIEKFCCIRQGPSTNNLTKLRADKKTGLELNFLHDEATIKKGSFILTIPDYSKIKGLKTSTHQLLDALTIKLTETGAASPNVKISLSEYMATRGLKDRKEAKQQVKNDMQILRTASLTWEETNKGKTECFKFVNIADSGEVKRNGDIVFTFGSTFYKALLKYSVMPYPNQLQTLNNRKNPNSYCLLRKISEHKCMNFGKVNENLISVKTLLNSAPYIPSYEEVMGTNRNLKERIIEVFERDMSAFEETATWNYCHKLGKPLSNEELKEMDYNLFENLLVKINWKDYPIMTLKRSADSQNNDNENPPDTP